MSNNVDWPGLLKWSLKYSDGTSPRAARSKEDLQFLEKAIKEFFANEVDPNQLVKDAVPKLSSPEQASAALAVIQECLDLNAEISRNLDKLGAMEPLVNCLKTTDSLTLETCLSVLSFALPNNAPIQQKFFELGGLEILLNEIIARKDLLENNENEIRLFSRLMTCLSATVKNETKVTEAFIKANNGVCTLIEILHSNKHAKILAKVLGIVRYFIDTPPNSNSFPKEQVAQGLVHAMTVIGTNTNDWGSSERVIDTTLHLVDSWLLLHRGPEQKWSPKSSTGQQLKAEAEKRFKSLGEIVLQEDCAADEASLLKQLIQKL